MHTLSLMYGWRLNHGVSFLLRALCWGEIVQTHMLWSIQFRSQIMVCSSPRTWSGFFSQHPATKALCVPFFLQNIDNVRLVLWPTAYPSLSSVNTNIALFLSLSVYTIVCFSILWIYAEDHPYIFWLYSKYVPWYAEQCPFVQVFLVYFYVDVTLFSLFFCILSVQNHWS